MTVTYDATSPDTFPAFPPIVPLRPPIGAPNVLVILIDDVGFGASSAFGGPCQTPDLRASGGRWPQIHPLSHHRAVLAHPRRADGWPQPPWAASARRWPPSAPGYSSLRPNTCAPLPNGIAAKGDIRTAAHRSRDRRRPNGARSGDVGTSRFITVHGLETEDDRKAWACCTRSTRPTRRSTMLRIHRDGRQPIDSHRPEIDPEHRFQVAMLKQ